MSVVTGQASVRDRNRTNNRARTRVGAWWAQSASTQTRTSLLLVLVIAVLNIIGLVMVLSASSVRAIDDKGTPWWFFERQLLWTLAGVVGFLFASRFDYRNWRRVAVPLIGGAFVLLVIVLIPQVGITVDGARRWLGYGPFRVQPSELAKIAMIVGVADVLTRREHEMNDWRRSLQPVLIMMAVITALMMAEPDLASLMVIGVMVLAMLVVGGVRARYLAVPIAFGVTFVTALAIMVPWRRARMIAFLDPWHDRANTGYQVVQSLIATGSGGLTGVGLGAGRAKWRFLPAAHTDFIFAVIGEELGLLGCGLVVALFVMIAVIGVRTAARAPDRFGMILAAGATAWIIGQALMNLGGVVGLLPVTGVPLPFVSFGGTALVSTMIGAGIVVNIARQGRS